jgi:RNA recognition motif-containing protein
VAGRKRPASLDFGISRGESNPNRLFLFALCPDLTALLFQPRASCTAPRRTPELNPELDMINIFIGNLGPEVTEEQLLNLFALHGGVDSVTLIKDRDTGLPRGIAFVEMRNIAEAETAISSLNGAMLNGCVLRVNEARSKPAEDAARPSSRARDHRRHRM